FRLSRGGTARTVSGKTLVASLTAIVHCGWRRDKYCSLHPIPTRTINMAKTFGFESTADEVLEGVNLSGKRVLVTGASAGLGIETIRSLVAHGATVVGTARDLSKARRALDQAEPGLASKIQLVDMDLASLKSARKAADQLLADGKPFDVVIANA